ncbi:MAG: nucleotidyltransferase domain-containing protein [Proteobacteria bacterium]|nr:nucleotidyltransferase domain-containing protein [Pseudomonadota bacterium]
MRLSQDHINIIKNTAKEIYGDVPVRLFGSRVDDVKKGGDIDLFIETKTDVSLQQKINFLVKLEKAGIERKVDLIVQSPSSKFEPIFETAKQTGIFL